MLQARTALSDEFDRVMAFYTRMIDEMRGTDFDVRWKHGEHPSPTFLRASVDAGEAYLVEAPEDGAIASAMVLNGSGASGYENVPWRVSADLSEVSVIHVLATLPAYHGRGCARALLNGGIAAARAHGKKALRLDTFADNERSHRLYESCGFQKVGIHDLFYDDLGTVGFVLYELAL